MWRKFDKWVRVAGETPPSQATRPDEPSAAVQAAFGFDERFDESQSGQVFPPSKISPRTIEASEFTQNAKLLLTFVTTPIESSAVASSSPRCDVPAKPPELMAGRRGGAVKLPVCRATPIDVGTNEADDDSDVGQAVSRGDCPHPSRCRLPAFSIGIGVIDRDLEEFDGCSKIISAGDAPSFVQVLGVPTPTCHGMPERRPKHPVQATELTANGTANETHDDQLPIRGRTMEIA